MALSRPHWVEVRTRIQEIFSINSPLKGEQNFPQNCTVSAQDMINHVPARIGDYTDFYSSRSHAFNVGSIIRGPANALN